MGPHGEYRLSDVALDITGGSARFSAKLIGPQQANVWARAWISNDQGTISETASQMHPAGDRVTLDVPLPASTEGCEAYMRLESAPLETEHVVKLRLQ